MLSSSGFLFVVVLLLCVSFCSEADSPNSFEQAKRIATKIFYDKRETLYCGCQYNEDNAIDLTSCHMESASHIARAHRVEWEHMVPAEHIGREFPCWSKSLCSQNGKPYKGRKCCEKIDPEFRHAESELYNLWPSVGIINQIRSNFSYAELDNRESNYGCDFKVDGKKRQAEPSDAVKGLVARAHLFMALKHGVRLTTAQKKLFTLWHTLYPVSDWELEWASRVEKIEGYPNPFITRF
jgi:deoxyribonuclease-1